MNILKSFVGVLTVVSLFCCGAVANAETEKPNIVIVIADDLGWGDLGLNGNPVVKTPNLDRLASEGVVIDRFFVNAVCSPTRAELLTGRYAVRGGVWSTSAGGERLDLDEVTLADVLKKNGYRTGLFGKWHNGMQYPYHPNARGFDEFFGYCSGHWGSYVDAMLEHNSEMIQTKGYLTDVLTEKAIDFLTEDSAQPAFVVLSLNTPHSPMQVTDKWWNPWASEKLPQHPNSEREKVNKTRAAYAMTENIDWNMGRLTASISNVLKDSNTIVIFLSDNGPNGNRWNGGMKGIKGTVDEGGVRSPAIVRWNGHLEAGRNVSQIAHVTDLFPTVLDLVGIEYQSSKPLDGLSLAPVLQHTSSESELSDRLVFSYWSGKLSVRSQNYRFSNNNELFDMVKDPEQTVDVSARFPEISDRLQSAAEKWNQEVLSELPKVDDRAFSIAHENARWDWLPARDGIVQGGIVRSNRWPNCSFYTNWKSLDDSISWPVEVLSDGLYEVVVYYTCPQKDIGSVIQVRCGQHQLEGQITEAFESPLRGDEYDRYEREESYVKDFNALKLGQLRLSKGRADLVLEALDMPGSQVMDFRLLTLKRAVN